jgi:hypothetical protein
MKRPALRSGYVLCVKNGGHAASLELRKVYRRLDDARASTGSVPKAARRALADTR